jgi:uncharacterized caspase-like protein
LPTALNDADSISKKLALLDFKVTHGENKTRNEMEDLIDKFISECPLKGTSDMVFYFSGHGCGSGV